MDKVKTFEKELEYIVDDNIKESAKTMIELLPDYFFHEAASSTGKYHPSYALGDGGLVRHTKAAVRVAYELLSDPAIGDKYTRSEKDVVIMSLILHDGLKRGLKEEKYTRFDHPILMANYVLENKDKLSDRRAASAPWRPPLRQWPDGIPCGDRARGRAHRTQDSARPWKGGRNAASSW